MFFGARLCFHPYSSSTVTVSSGSDSELSTKPGLLVSGSERPLGLSVVVDTLLLASRPPYFAAVVVEVVLLVNGNLWFTTFWISF